MLGASVRPHTVCILFFALAASFAAHAQSSLPVYQPRFDDGEPSRVGLESRSAGSDNYLIVLAPNVKGGSATSTPELFWYIDQSTDSDLEIVVQELAADKPLLQIEVTDKIPAGYGSIRMADYNVELKPGVEYEWSVSLIVDEDKRSSDMFSKGSIQYDPTSLRAGIDTPSRSTIGELVANGYWYDAIALIEARLRESANDTEAVEWREQLLASQNIRRDNGNGAQ